MKSSRWFACSWLVLASGLVLCTRALAEEPPNFSRGRGESISLVVRVEVHAAAWRLLAVAQRGVEDSDQGVTHPVAPGVSWAVGSSAAISSKVPPVRRRQYTSIGPEEQ